MVTRTSLIAKIEAFSPQNGYQREPDTFHIEYNSSGIVPLKVYPALSLLNLTQPELCQVSAWTT
ncbi:hypothetical protein [Caldifermentibacillus hisashii]|uniref:hypothetical protein n=1 Tax=Caldifermentibacillus hisashii TaxID=996558 RepID=UPI003D1CA935